MLTEIGTERLSRGSRDELRAIAADRAALQARVVAISPAGSGSTSLEAH